MQTKRPPIVTVLGHVDHGKTSLLDAIFKSNVTAREAGGITQSIGARQVETDFGTITFIDTPGHAAFSKMRSRGSRVADIAILVVAADDGVMPQTKEALTLIKAAQIPYIVALTKVDLATANVEKVKGQLESEGVLFEGRGGDVPSLEVSSKKGEGITNLLELISLISDVTNIEASADGKLEAVVIETNKEKQGVLASVVVRNGTLIVGDSVSSGDETIKVRGLFDYQNKSVKSIAPGSPAMILGFTMLPDVGAVIYRPTEGEPTKQTAEAPKVQQKTTEDSIRVILKASAQGSLEALIAMVPKEIFIQDSAVGDVSESDVFLAKTTGSIIVTFDSKTSNSIHKLAENDHIEIHSFRIIYELINFLEMRVHAGDLVILGKAEILGVFPYENKKVAGVKIQSGRIAVKDTLILSRGTEELGRVKVVSIRKLKDQIPEAKEGQECGIIFEPQKDFQVRDILTAIKA